jgi:hypothetical protein
VEEAARAHVNRHVLKMVVETYQLLSAAHWMIDPAAAAQLPAGVLCKLTQYNHPCAVWVRAHPNNYQWLASLGLALCAEYTRRFATVRRPAPKHACLNALVFLHQHPPQFPAHADAPLNEHGLTEPVQCMPEQYRVPGDAVAAYRNYYQSTEKADLRWWRPSGAPVTHDDHEDYAPAWFTARPLTPQQNFLDALARARRQPKKVKPRSVAQRKRPVDDASTSKRACLADVLAVGNPE